MGKPSGGKKGRGTGRKKRKYAFQRYKVSDRFMDKLKRHVARHPNDRLAGLVLEAMKNSGSWVKWREAEKTGRDSLTGAGLPGRGR